MSETSVEYDIKAKGKSAARVTPEDVIASEVYFTAGSSARGRDLLRGMTMPYQESPRLLDLLDHLMICVLVLKNGFMVTGDQMCTSQEHFDESIGKRIARSKAVDKIWPLLGYELMTKLAASAAE